jgi:hypothetical protein
MSENNIYMYMSGEQWSVRAWISNNITEISLMFLLNENVYILLKLTEV